MHRGETQHSRWKSSRDAAYTHAVQQGLEFGTAVGSAGGGATVEQAGERLGGGAHQPRRAQAVGGLVASLAPPCVHLRYFYTRVDCSTASALHVLSVGPSAAPIKGLECNEPCEACDDSARVRRALKDRDVRCSPGRIALASPDFRHAGPDVYAGTACASQDDKGNMWLVVPK